MVKDDQMEAKIDIVMVVSMGFPWFSYNYGDASQHHPLPVLLARLRAAWPEWPDSEARGADGDSTEARGAVWGDSW